MMHVGRSRKQFLEVCLCRRAGARAKLVLSEVEVWEDDAKHEARGCEMREKHSPKIFPYDLADTKRLL